MQTSVFTLLTLKDYSELRVKMRRAANEKLATLFIFQETLEKQYLFVHLRS